MVSIQTVKSHKYAICGDTLNANWTWPSRKLINEIMVAFFVENEEGRWRSLLLSFMITWLKSLQESAAENLSEVQLVSSSKVRLDSKCPPIQLKYW